MAVLLFLILACFHGCSRDGEKESEKVSPKVDEIVRKVSEYFNGVKNFSVEMTISLNARGLGRNRKMGVICAVAMQRPNRLSIVPKSGKTIATLVCDGAKVNLDGRRRFSSGTRHWH